MSHSSPTSDVAAARRVMSGESPFEVTMCAGVTGSCGWK